jgi:Gram-negative bacterial TonB protein C-terminal
MSESNAVRLSRVAFESGASDFFEARIASRTVPIQLAYSAIRDLRTNLPLAGDNAGLLLGTSSPAALSIANCELLSLRPDSAVDDKSLAAALHGAVRARLQAPRESASQLLGFFRTQTDGWPDIRESDLQIVRRHFRESGALVLLIQTTEHRPWSAALFALSPGGASGSRTPALEFFFDEYLLRSGYSADLAPVLPSLPPEAPAPRRMGWWIALAAVSVIVAGVGLYSWLSRLAPKNHLEPASVSSPVPSPLGLKVNRSGKDFEVSWDRFSNAVTQATAGMLTIHDGAITRIIQINSSQLREGRILYTPLFEELTFRLEVGGDGEPTGAESVQVLAWSAKPSSPSDLTTPGRLPLPAQTLLPPVNTSPEARLRLPVPDSQLSPGPFAPVSVGRVDPREAAKTAEPERRQTVAITPADEPEPRAPVPPTAVAQPRQEPAPPSRDAAATAGPAANSTAPAAPERPSVRVSASQPVASTAPQSSGTATSTPIVPSSSVPERPPVRQNTSPLSTSVLPSATGLPRTSVTVTAPTAPPKPTPVATAPVSYVAPVPVRQEAPTIGRDVRSILDAMAGKEITVSVKVSIDTSGVVKKAEVVSVNPTIAGPDFHLRAAAAEAAKAWRFQPGSMNGQTIASESVIAFKFR